MADVTYYAYLQYAYFVRPILTKELIPIMKSAYITDENLRIIIDDIGDRLMSLITDTAMIQKSPAYQTLLAEQEKQQALAEKEKQQALLIAEQEKQQLLHTT